MPNRKEILVCLLICCFTSLANISYASPKDTIFNIDDGFQEVMLAPYCKWAFEKEGQEIGVKDLQSGSVDLDFKSIDGRLFHRGYGKPKNAIWFKFTLRNSTKEVQQLVFEIPYPNIDLVDFYAFYLDSLLKHQQAGIQFPFEERAVQHRNFSFLVKMPAGATQEFYLRLERKYDEMLLPFRLQKTENYIGNSVWETLGDGLLLGGFVLFILILGAYAIKNPDTLVLSFLAMMIAILLFHLGDGGLGFQFFWPDAPGFQPKARPLGSFISQTAFIFFTIVYFDMPNRKQYSWAKLSGFSMMAIYGILTVHILVMDWSWFSWLPHKDFFVNIFLLLLVGVISWGIAVCIQSKFWKSWDAGFFAIAFMMPAIGCLVLALRNSEILPYNYFTSNFLKFAHIVMIISLGTAITKRVLEMKRKTARLEQEKHDWLQEKANHQVELIDATTVAIEREREHLATHLHDGLGALLVSVQHHFASLAQHFEEEYYGAAYQRIRNLLAQSYEETRKISHDMALHTLKEEGFLPVVEDYCRSLETFSLKVSFWQYGLEDGLHPLQAQNCYRIIQELTSNVIKHAEATELMINISKSEGQISITVEDNGKGFVLDCSDNPKSGLGVKSIKSRVRRMQGKLDYHSEIGKGTSVFIEIPDLQHTHKTNKKYEEANN